MSGEGSLLLGRTSPQSITSELKIPVRPRNVQEETTGDNITTRTLLLQVSSVSPSVERKESVAESPCNYCSYLKFISKILPSCCFRRIALRFDQQCAFDNLASPTGPRPSSPPPSYAPPVSSRDPLQFTSLSCARPLPSTTQSAPLLGPQEQESTAESPVDTPTPDGATGKRSKSVSALHPQVAVILGVPKVWHVFLQGARLMSMGYSVKCLITSLYALFNLVLVYDTTPFKLELRQTEQYWTLEKSLEAISVFLAAIWCGTSAYLSFFFTDCLMSRWLLNYTPFATLLRLSMTDFLLAYVPSIALARLGAHDVLSRLLPAWIVITFVSFAVHYTYVIICPACLPRLQLRMEYIPVEDRRAVAIAYHLTHDLTSIKRETEATRKVLFGAMAITVFLLILPHHIPIPSKLCASI